MTSLTGHFGLVALLVAGFSLTLWLFSSFIPRLAVHEGARSVGVTTTRVSLILAVCGWAAFPLLFRPLGLSDYVRFTERHPGADWDAMNQVQADVQALGFGVMMGVAVAALAVRMGIYLELRRLAEGGTPVRVMAARATVFFLALSGISMLVLRDRFRMPMLASLSSLWGPAMLVWWKHRTRTSMEPVISTAWRATFFGLAVTALSSIAIVVYRERIGAGGLSLGLWWGTAMSAAILVLAAWCATALSPGRAIAVSGFLCGVAGAILESI